MTDLAPGEIGYRDDRHGRRKLSIRCPRCENVSYLANWFIDNAEGTGCDWCDYDPEQLVIEK